MKMGSMLQKMQRCQNIIIFYLSIQFHCLNRFFQCIEFGDEAHIGAIDARTPSTQKQTQPGQGHLLRQQSWIGHRQKRLLTSIQPLYKMARRKVSSSDCLFLFPSRPRVMIAFLPGCLVEIYLAVLFILCPTLRSE